MTWESSATIECSGHPDPSGMVMSLSCLDDILGKRSLGQEGIGSNSFPLNFNGIEERDGSLDFVCLFFPVASFHR